MSTSHEERETEARTSQCESQKSGTRLANLCSIPVVHRWPPTLNMNAARDLGSEIQHTFQLKCVVKRNIKVPGWNYERKERE